MCEINICRYRCFTLNFYLFIYFFIYFLKDIVQLLLDNGANSHIQNHSGDCVRTMDDVCTEIKLMIAKSEE